VSSWMARRRAQQTPDSKARVVWVAALAIAATLVVTVVLLVTRNTRSAPPVLTAVERSTGRLRWSVEVPFRVVVGSAAMPSIWHEAEELGVTVCGRPSTLDVFVDRATGATVRQRIAASFHPPNGIWTGSVPEPPSTEVTYDPAAGVLISTQGWRLPVAPADSRFGVPSLVFGDSVYFVSRLSRCPMYAGN